MRVNGRDRYIRAWAGDVGGVKLTTLLISFIMFQFHDLHFLNGKIVV